MTLASSLIQQQRSFEEQLRVFGNARKPIKKPVYLKQTATPPPRISPNTGRNSTGTSLKFTSWATVQTCNMDATCSRSGRVVPGPPSQIIVGTRGSQQSKHQREKPTRGETLEGSARRGGKQQHVLGEGAGSIHREHDESRDQEARTRRQRSAYSSALDARAFRGAGTSSPSATPLPDSRTAFSHPARPGKSLKQ